MSWSERTTGFRSRGEKAKRSRRWRSASLGRGGSGKRRRALRTACCRCRRCHCRSCGGRWGSPFGACAVSRKWAMATQHQLEPLPPGSRGGRRRCAPAASAAGDRKLRGAGATLPGGTRSADRAAAGAFVGRAEGHRSTASGENLDRNRRTPSSV